MKKLLISAICMAFALSSTMGQSSVKEEMLFDKTLHDYGSIVFGSDGNCEFVFKNSSNKPIVLTDVKSSCGCSVPTWSKEPIKPGDSSSIKVQYNTQLPGVFNKTITVYSNAKNSPVRLSIMGKVQAQHGDVKQPPKSQTKGVALENDVNNLQSLQVIEQQTGSSVRGATAVEGATQKTKSRANVEMKSGGGNQ